MSSLPAPATPPPAPGDRQQLIPGLPDDISARILARLPLPSLRAASLLSRAHHSFVTSRALLSTRCADGFKAPALILCLRSPSISISLLSPPLSLPPPPVSAIGAAFASHSCALYLIGGSVSGIPSASVYVFRHGQWSLGPRMSLPREFAAAGVVADKLYVIGGCFPLADHWAEVLDVGVASSKWEKVHSPASIREKWMHGNAVIGDCILAVADHGGVVYDTRNRKWSAVPMELDMGWKGRAAVVDGVLYSYDYLGHVKGYDFKDGKWKAVEGLDRRLPKFLYGATLADVSGVLCLVWEGKGIGHGLGANRKMVVDWAGIKVLRTEDGRLSGCILWLESVAVNAPKGSSIAHCLALEL